MIPLVYYGTRLSENLSLREPEGFLLCLNVPVARTGTQDYLPQELGLPPGPSLIPVYRPEEEVFSPECIASFEGMAVTNDHPPDGVTVENARSLQRGHAHNVRRGSGEESDLLLADLIITDPTLIDAILHGGKREISCGYTYDLCEENGQYIQRKIRGNHVAVVDAGRAGHRVSIKDEQASESSIPRMPAMLQPSIAARPCRSGDGSRRSQEQASRFMPAMPQPTLFERSKHMKKSLFKKLCRMAKDGDPEAAAALAEIVEELTEASGPDASGDEVTLNVFTEPAAEAPAPAAADPTVDPAVEIVTPEGAQVAVDDADLAAVLERLDRIIALLSPAPAADEDPVEALVAEILESDHAAPAVQEEILSSVLDPDAAVPFGDDDPEADPSRPEHAADRAGAALRAALSVFRPALNRLSPAERLRFNADVAARLKGKARPAAADGKPGPYAALLAGGARDVSGRALGQRIMASRNANLRK